MPNEKFFTTFSNKMKSGKKTRKLLRKAIEDEKSRKDAIAQLFDFDWTIKILADVNCVHFSDIENITETRLQHLFFVCCPKTVDFLVDYIPKDNSKLSLELSDETCGFAVKSFTGTINVEKLIRKAIHYLKTKGDTKERIDYLCKKLQTLPQTLEKDVEKLKIILGKDVTSIIISYLFDKLILDEKSMRIALRTLNEIPPTYYGKNIKFPTEKDLEIYLNVFVRCPKDEKKRLFYYLQNKSSYLLSKFYDKYFGGEILLEYLSRGERCSSLNEFCKDFLYYPFEIHHAITICRSYFVKEELKTLAIENKFRYNYVIDIEKTLYNLAAFNRLEDFEQVIESKEFKEMFSSHKSLQDGINSLVKIMVDDFEKFDSERLTCFIRIIEPYVTCKELKEIVKILLLSK